MLYWRYCSIPLVAYYGSLYLVSHMVGGMIENAEIIKINVDWYSRSAVYYSIRFKVYLPIRVNTTYHSYE